LADCVFGAFIFVIDFRNDEEFAVRINNLAACLQGKMIQIKPALGLLQLEDGELSIYIGTSGAAPVFDLPVCAMGLDYQILDDSFHK